METSGYETDLMHGIRNTRFLPLNSQHYTNRTSYFLELYRNKDEFIILTDRVQPYKLEVLDCHLLVRAVEPVKSLILSLETQLAKTTAKYPIRRSVTKVLHLAAERQDLPLTQIYTGILPRWIIVAMVCTANFFVQEWQIHSISKLLIWVSFWSEPGMKRFLCNLFIWTSLPINACKPMICFTIIWLLLMGGAVE